MENIFRAVNIALVNELKVVYSAHGHRRVGSDRRGEDQAVRLHGVLSRAPASAATAFPSIRSICRGRPANSSIHTRFIELAGEINRAMPRLVIQALQDALNQRFARALKGASILVCGLAYKKNVDDLRESPALRIIEILRDFGAKVSYHDPFIPEMKPTREHGGLLGMESVTFDARTLQSFDAALIVTDHDAVDYDALVTHSKLVVDTRNVTKAVREGREKIVLA